MSDSHTARWPSDFAIASRDEAVAYLGHGILGSRLRECTALVNAVEGRTIREILGSPDDLKFNSSMTLFGAVSSDPEFAEAVTKFYGGTPDQRDVGPAWGLSMTFREKTGRKKTTQAPAE